MPRQYVRKKMLKAAKVRPPRCCICETLEVSIPQDRGTGPNLVTKRYWFCDRCWQRHCEICGPGEREMIANV